MAAGPRPSCYVYERQSTTRSPAVPTWPGANGATIKTWPYEGNIIDNGPGNPVAMDGLPLAGLSAILVTAHLCGQYSRQSPPPSMSPDTFAGGGSLVCWIASPYMQVPVRFPDLDLSFGWGGVTARNTRGWPALREVGRLGTYIWFLANGVTITGTATDLLVRIDGFQDTGGVH